MSAPGRRLMLERRVTGSNTGGVADVLLLHDGEGRPEQLVDFAAALSARRCIIPRAPRWASLRGEGLYSWFTSPAYGVVDPVGLGDSLSQLEMLLLSAGDESPNGKLGAVGFGQGAVMAATLAALWPERFAWVGLVGGFWPALPDELVPARPMHDLPVAALAGLAGEMFDISALADRGARCLSLAPTTGQSAVLQWIAAVDSAELVT